MTFSASKIETIWINFTEHTYIMKTPARSPPCIVPCLSVSLPRTPSITTQGQLSETHTQILRQSIDITEYGLGHNIIFNTCNQTPSTCICIRLDIQFLEVQLVHQKSPHPKASQLFIIPQHKIKSRQRIKYGPSCTMKFLSSLASGSYYNLRKEGCSHLCLFHIYFKENGPRPLGFPFS